MLRVRNEYGELKKVMVASVDTFHLHEPINLTQEYFYKNDPPVVSRMIEEQNAFVEVLQKFGVDVVWADRREDCTNQVNTRDVAFVVGNTFVVSPMRKPERMNEHYALETLIKSFSDEDRVLRPKMGFIEGGDIILDETTMYVGISQRTNDEGLRWLIETFSSDFDVVPVYLNEGYLHLDCVFNLLSSTDALVLEPGIRSDSLQKLTEKYNVIFACPDEQINLPTNVFSVNPTTVVADKRNVVTNSLLKAHGKQVIELDYSESSKIGGSFRCSTCPLRRE